MRIPRDYQLACIEETNKLLVMHDSAVIVMATGLGKTFVFSRIAENWTHGNVLVLAHRIELVDQATDSLSRELGYKPIVEQGTKGIDPDWMDHGGMIVVGSIQSMITDRRLRKFRDFPFGLIIIDECHRATAPSYRKLIDYYRKLDPACRVLGVTATPNRTDGTALGLVFDHVAFNMGIVEGIDQGWLVDVHQKFAVLGKVDFSNLRLTKNQFGEIDFNAEDLEKVMKEEDTLHEMSRPVLDTTEGGKQAVIFASSVAHAHVWASVLNRYKPGSAAAVSSHTDHAERVQNVTQFKDGNLQYLLNYGVFTEGFDAPNTSMVVMGRPTKSLLTYTQMLGRGTRPLPKVVDNVPTADGRKDAIAASAKPWVTVLDFVGNSNQHRIVSATDVLGGSYDVEEREVAGERLRNKDGNVREAIKKAKAAMLLATEERKRAGIKFEHVDYQLQDVDPFGASGVGLVPRKTRGTITDGQLSLLQKLGVAYETAVMYSRQQAGVVITKLGAKRCTTGQAKVLRKFGYNAENYSMAGASAMIDQIKQNGWRRLECTTQQT